MGSSDDAVVSRASEVSRKGGHESSAASHVRGDMQALATNVVASDPVVELIHAGRHRDALAACARTHHVVLGRLCMALLGSQADADEAVQETLLRAHRAMTSYRAEGSVKEWLCGIARHVCAHMLETLRRGLELLELVPTEGEARDVFALRRRARVLRDALEKLKP